MILLIDNYDSFTFNLVHLIGGLGEETRVVRNDALTAAEAIAMGPEAVVLSPGPCTPNEAGICLDLVAAAAESKTPVFGVCLGMQSIAQSFGGVIRRAGKQMHGKTSEIIHEGDGIFAGLPSPFTATRYHSLVAERTTLSNALAVTARAADDDEIMALAHRELPIFGVQFHPESIATEHGAAMISNFLKSVRK
ncbi:MAG: aminodeoxychorismate/anthranilate synthase component II [Parvularculaceae bacterium]